MPSCLVTELQSGAQALVYPQEVFGDLALDGDALGRIRQTLEADESGTVELGGKRLFLQVQNPPLRLIIIGAVHIAQTLAPMAALAGYSVTIVDPRRAFATDARFPDVKLIGDWPDEAMATMKLDRRTAVVTLTHDPKLDDPALQTALKADVFYIGALGSRKTHAARLGRLKAAGFSDDRVRAHPWARRPRHRRAVAGRDRRLDPGADHRGAARCRRRRTAREGGMIFADLPVLDAVGALLVHSVKVGKLAFRKGRRLSPDDVRALADAGRATVTVARLDQDDIGEDAAATRIAEALAGPNVMLATAFTGRCNILATAAGVLVVDRERLDRINLVDEAVTIATLPPYDVAQPREMVATVKIIPFAVSRAVLDACIAVATDGRAARARRRVPPALRRPDPDPAARHQGERAGQDGRCHQRPPRRPRLPAGQRVALPA